MNTSTRRALLTLCGFFGGVACAQFNEASSARLAAERQILSEVAKAFGAKPVLLSSTTHCRVYQQHIKDARLEAFIIPRPYAKVRPQLSAVQTAVNRTARPRVTAVKLGPELPNSVSVYFQYGRNWLFDSAQFNLFANGTSTELCLFHTP